MDRDELIARTEAWIAGDPDPATRAELRRLLEQGAWEELADRMDGTLTFGTAGLRGRVEAGSNRMNRAVVIRASRGLADYLLARHGGSPLVVVGRDARTSSEQFMEDAVGVFLAAGLQVARFPQVTPTPLIAYAARTLAAQCAVAITASHNPPADNGYKVYDANAVQIIPPVDEDISRSIAAVGPARDVPIASTDGASNLGDEMFDKYLGEIGDSRPDGGASELKIVYTPLHGVGGRYVVAALDHFGHRNVVPVAEQFDPDGRFPTVAFPNPEEPGALDLALALAEARGADLVIANDPDTDRLAVAVPHSGSFRMLSGNQVGVLLGDDILAGRPRRGPPPPLVINSVVSTPMLEAIAVHHGARFATTLTGFKWIWNAALDLEADEVGRFVFGFEEALGYSVGRAVRDKDGISAAVAFADLAAAEAVKGSSVMERLAGLYREHGLWVSTQRSVVRTGADGAEEISAAMDRLRAAPPAGLAGFAVTAVSDFLQGDEHRPRYLPAANLVALELGDAGRTLIRPSGTEPKLKIYVDLVGPAGDDVWLAESELLDRANAVATDAADSLGLD